MTTNTRASRSMTTPGPPEYAAIRQDHAATTPVSRAPASSAPVSSATGSTGAGRRPGRRNAAATAAARQRSPTTTQAADIADMNQSWNADSSRGSCPATTWATPTESWARPTPEPGSAENAPAARCEPNTDEKTEP